MKNTLTLLFTLILSTSTFAASDSIGVFHRPEKVLVLINERGSNARLQEMMNAFGIGDTLQAITADETVKISCAREESLASCTFRFLPGKDVTISGKTVQAKALMTDLKLETSESFEMYFESSMADKFLLKVENGLLTISAGKKQL